MNTNTYSNLDYTDKNLSKKTFYNINFTNQNINWDDFIVDNTTFLGCEFKKSDKIKIISNGAFVYPKFKNIPYNAYRSSLYSWRELMEGYSNENDHSLDIKIYNHFSKNKFTPSINEALSQRIHDHAIDNSLRELVGYNKLGMTDKKCVGFMGGHSIARGHNCYINTALTAKLIAEKGYFVTTGGGPGIMEAANLGAYFSGRENKDLLDAIDILSKAPIYTSDNYIEQAKSVLDKYPSNKESLAIPTWFYGHEPSNLFASHIAKYFSNSIREDILLAISLYGVIYARGSAGTTQEIFMEAAQNHYGTFGYYSPMIFLGVDRYSKETPLYSTIQHLSKGMEYNKLLLLSDDYEQIVDFIENNPPIKVKKM